ncbi:Spore coat polysaccharide biosynthesis protein SpsG, predicted glycosyltransferase [Raineyella antarctica]|uniref:Spore coat polysaccharide biosynthesis protein SpsG, predicted glycosyltransferase n=1 Tax=Raineyella antarctica TaxID=1577474 RepID=A0A1G6GF41_9ACTN|nr:spore coat protein [Raineyella antarctica]SDB80628.1 Spore coat polysaccharide biosynthesis protein SpsG, predicted glycosyltransferase [Raineyella antarctica]
MRNDGRTGTDDPTTPRIGLRCDGGPQMGVGHVLRQLALAEEFIARGIEVTLLGTVQGSPLVDGLLGAHGLAMTPVGDDAAALVATVRDLGLDVVMLDGYQLPVALGTALRAAGIPVATMVDGRFGLDQDADLYIDQNFGAVRDPGIPVDRQVLAGIGYALLRDVVRSRRGARSRSGPLDTPGARGPYTAPATEGRPRVLCVFGGTDAYGAALTVVPLLLSTGAPVEVVAVAANEGIAAELRTSPTGPDQVLEVIGPVSDLPGLAATCDGVVSAAGTSIWEFFCLGVPTALVAVVPNQLVGYDQVLEADLVAPVGLLPDLREEPGASTGREVLHRFVTDAAWREGLGARGAALVDGDGRVRVADAMLALRP